jgi:hypothetical protein
MRPFPDYGYLFTMQEFIDACGYEVSDYDGFGNLSTATEMSDERIIPSDIKRGKKIDPKYTHVLWFNR